MPSISIIIPFRDRHDHLKVLVPKLRSVAQNMKLDIEIIVAEQVDAAPLRRGALRNEGARIASGDVFVFHDVDYVPDDKVIYWPKNAPDMMAFRAVHRVEFIKMDGTPRPENDTPAGYRTFKDGIDKDFFGGVVCVSRKAFYHANGYNPLYEGWGLEDTEFRDRIRAANIPIEDGWGTFRALPHPDSFKNDDLFRRNQFLYNNQVKVRFVGINNTKVHTILNEDKKNKYEVDKWVDVTDWQVFNPLEQKHVEPIIVGLDYGYFALLKGAENDHVHAAVSKGERWEPIIMNLCERYTMPSTTVLDIGANMGTFAVRMSQLVGTEGNVIAFEPQRVIFQQLCTNIFLNNLRNVFTLQKAVGSRSGRVTLTPIDYSSGSPGEVRIFGNEGEEVDCVALDEMELTNVSLIKIDVERYEPFVFDGAQQTIKRNRPVILFELTTLPLPDYPKDYVVSMLRSMNYNIYEVSEWGDYLGLPVEKDGYA